MNLRCFMCVHCDFEFDAGECDLDIPLFPYEGDKCSDFEPPHNAPIDPVKVTNE